MARSPSTTTTAAGMASMRPSRLSPAPLTLPSLLGSEVQTDQDPLGVGEVADDLAHRFGQPALEGGDGDDLLALGQLRALEQVDDLDGVLAGEVLLADLPEVGERRGRSRRLAGDVQAQLPSLVVLLVGHPRPLARPVSTPPSVVTTSRNRMPRLLSWNSRIWFEWAMPLAFWTKIPRSFCASFSRLRSCTQLSISDEIDGSSLMWPSWIRLVNTAVIPLLLRWSTMRISIAFTSTDV